MFFDSRGGCVDIAVGSVAFRAVIFGCLIGHNPLDYTIPNLWHISISKTCSLLVSNNINALNAWRGKFVKLSTN